jgi:pentatricopeptide repeat protein
MTQRGLRADAATFGTLITAHSRSGDVDAAFRVLA